MTDNMTNTGTDLLRAILTDPADDTARLVYADWLECDADPVQPERAEFIRVQIELARAEYCPCNGRLPSGGVCSCAWCVNIPRECHLWGHGFGGLDVPPGLKSIYIARPRGQQIEGGFVSRGFVSQITCAAADWLQHHADLYWHPGQTEKCRFCDGLGQHYKRSGAIVWIPCHKCRDGRIDRPFPGGSVQPIERVVLTGEFQVGIWLSGAAITTARWIDANDRSKGFTDDRWPCIVFELPAVEDYRDYSIDAETGARAR